MGRHTRGKRRGKSRSPVPPEVDLTTATVPVIITLSGIEGAGFGVFATDLISKEIMIAIYCGELVTGREWTGNYVVCVDEQVFIDGCGTPRCVAAMINDARSNERNNCVLKTYSATQEAKVFATRDIQVGEELFMSYGPDYWGESPFV